MIWKLLRGQIWPDCRQTGLTSTQEDVICGYALIIPPIHERREVNPMNNLGSDKRKTVRNLRWLADNQYLFNWQNAEHVGDKLAEY